MRVAMLVAVAAAHLIMVLLFPSMWRASPRGSEAEPAVMPIFLPQMPESVPQPQHAPPPRWRQGTPALTDSSVPRGSRRSGQKSNTEQQRPREQRRSREQQRSIATPDWRAQLEETAQISAPRIVAAEDTARRRANALTSPFKPLGPPPPSGPEFGWDWAATHRLVPMARGGFVYSFNDNCQLAIYPMPYSRCKIGAARPNAALFRNMPGPHEAIQHESPGTEATR